jgi:hypothetical protein
MENLLIVPRDVLQRAYDALEEIPDWSEAGSETWILHQQLGMILYPDSAFIAPVQRMESLPVPEYDRG